MKNTIIFLFLIFQCLLTQAQTVNLSVSHHPIDEPIFYFVDYMETDGEQILQIELQRHDIRYFKTDVKAGKAIFLTRLLVVCNGELFSSKKEKKENLSFIKKENIESIERIDKKKAKDIYGKKGKNGALLISIK